MYYPAKYSQDSNSTVLMCFRDIPEACGVGETMDEACQSAIDGLETAFSLYMDDRRPIPKPSLAQADEIAIYLPATAQTKLALYNEMLAQGVSKAELARRLSVDQKHLDRLWDLTHGSRLELLENALAVLGRRLSVGLI